MRILLTLLLTLLAVMLSMVTTQPKVIVDPIVQQDIQVTTLALPKWKEHKEFKFIEFDAASMAAKLFIYQHESGNNPNSVNNIGCRGLGQDCNGQLPIACPNWRTDYQCQDNFFTAYMQKRYGTWEHAHTWWITHNWW